MWIKIQHQHTLDSITNAVFFAETMAMGKLHKEIGHLIVQSAEDTDRTDAQVIKVNCLKAHKKAT